jgi:hypothetical protein
MKAFDFSKPGGFPLTQNRLDYMQQAYTEAIRLLCAKNGDTVGSYLVSGQITRTYTGTGTIYNYAITDGLVLTANEVFRVVGGTLTGVDISTDAPFLEVTRTSSTLTFNDGSTPSVVKDVTLSLVSHPISTPNDATHFNINALLQIGVESSFTTITVSTGGFGNVTGTIKYRKNFANNHLHIKGSLTVNTPSTLGGATSGAFLSLATLDAVYLPSQIAHFKVFVKGIPYKLNDDSVEYLHDLNGWIDPGTGFLIINFKKPDAGVTSYDVSFNTLIPLD